MASGSTVSGKVRLNCESVHVHLYILFIKPWASLEDLYVDEATFYYSDSMICKDKRQVSLLPYHYLCVW